MTGITAIISAGEFQWFKVVLTKSFNEKYKEIVTNPNSSFWEEKKQIN